MKTSQLKHDFNIFNGYTKTIKIIRTNYFYIFFFICRPDRVGSPSFNIYRESHRSKTAVAFTFYLSERQLARSAKSRRVSASPRIPAGNPQTDTALSISSFVKSRSCAFFSPFTRVFLL